MRTAWAAPMAVLVCMMGVAACDEGGHGHEHGGHGHEHGGGHDHGEAIGITTWTDQLELFAEHPPAVAGEEMTLLAHLTVLDGFEPLGEANVTLVLEGPERVQASVEQSVRPGIFEPSLVPKQPGTYKARLEVTAPDLEETVGGFSIEVHPSHDAAHGAADAQNGEGEHAVSFSKEQQWKVPFATAFATERTIVPTVEVAGEGTTPPDGTAHVGAPVAGRIVAPGGGFPRPGQKVEQGTLLARIAPTPASPENTARTGLTLAEAKARLSEAKAAVARSKRLREADAIPERELVDARRELEVARQALRAARRSRRMYQGASSGRGGGSWRVQAPMGGTVAEVRATPGESVSAGQPLFRIVDNRELWVRAKVPEQRAAELRTELDASYRITGSDVWQPLRVSGDRSNASLVSVDPTVDPKSRTVAVTYALSEPDPKLRIGGLVHVAIPAGEPTTGVAVPRGAVVPRNGAHVVFVQRTGETFVERTVEVGPRAGGYVAVHQGLEAGERVVTRGGHLLRVASRGAAGAGHGHVH